MNKGITVSQVARVSRDFTASGIMVHAYLMYGFPTQTAQETIDSLEMVRQLFENGIIQSGFWHQFALTAHSPVGLNPEEYGITPSYKNISFANNDIDFIDPTFAPGTGTPEVGGPNSFQALQVVRELKGVNLIGMDLVEVSPPFDQSGATSWLGISIVFEMMCILAQLKDN